MIKSHKEIIKLSLKWMSNNLTQKEIKQIIKSKDMDAYLFNISKNLLEGKK